MRSALVLKIANDFVDLENDLAAREEAFIAKTMLGVRCAKAFLLETKRDVLAARAKAFVGRTGFSAAKGRGDVLWPRARVPLRGQRL